jgi:hypothetical protein
MDGATNVLAMLAWAGAGGSAICVAVALVRPARRRVALVLAAFLLLPIGILGILSIGIFFLAAAVLCLIGAIMGRPPAGQKPEPSP